MIDDIETKTPDERLTEAAAAVFKAVLAIDYLKKQNGTRGLAVALTQLEQGHILLQHEIFNRGLPSIYSPEGGKNIYVNETGTNRAKPEDKRSAEHKAMDDAIARKGQVDLDPDQMLRIFESPQFASEMGYRIVYNKDHGVWAVSLKG